MFVLLLLLQDAFVLLSKNLSSCELLAVANLGNHWVSLALRLLFLYFIFISSPVYSNVSLTGKYSFNPRIISVESRSFLRVPARTLSDR